MKLYPLFVDLHGRQVLVVGGGAVAERKAGALLAAGASVSVGSPTLNPQLGAWAAAGRLHHREGRFTPEWLEGQWLVVSATDDPALNRQVAELAAARRVWVNVVDDRVLSSFHVPAVVDRAPLMVAISTGGAAPALAGLVRAHLEAALDHSAGALVGLSERLRTRIRRRFPGASARRRFYAWLWHGPVVRLLRARRVEAALETAEAALAAATPALGSVALVGAGPGAPELLTLGGLRRLQEADVILHDRLVSPEILTLARRDALLIDVGKTPGSRRTEQDTIHALMENHARRGRCVVRLKGGDPFIFGRGGEEIEYLRARGISYEVVPGVTSALACAAYAGVPLTHRALAHGVHLITAHTKDSIDALDWRALGRDKQTLAVYMSVAQLGSLRARLMAYGKSGATPVAFIENGTLPQQRVILGNLAELEELAQRHAITSPAMLIVGEVAALAGTLGWFGPLDPDGPETLTHAA
ncbi:MAG TPA: siroheme synthase CysG [Gammaproteobacteria bacterium]|nr:siroheme synthase CysG [Gammaproteobacteria bacterium]